MKWIKRIFISFIVFFLSFLHLDIRESTQALTPPLPLIEKIAVKEKGQKLTQKAKLQEEIKDKVKEKGQITQKAQNRAIPKKSWSMSLNKLSFASEQLKQKTDRCIKSMIQKHLKFEKKKEEGSSNEPYLALKDSCQKDKEIATACCSNPNSCDEGLDLAKGILPFAPAILTTWQGYKNSTKAQSGEISQEEFAQKRCDITNKMNLGSFGTNLLLQLSSTIETNCRDKIESCQESCNTEISDFKDDFTNCFQQLSPKDPSIDGITGILEEYWGGNGFDDDDFCNDPKACKQSPFKPDDSLRLSNIMACSNCSASCGGAICNLPNSCSCICSGENCNTCEAENKIEICLSVQFVKEFVGYALLFEKAYENSLKKEVIVNLTEESNEKEIVNCAQQSDRVPTPKTGPGGHVSPPVIDACKQAVQATLNNPPPRPGTPYQQPTRTPTTAAITGGELKKADVKGPSWLMPKPNNGLEDNDDDPMSLPDDLPDQKNLPKLQTDTQGWANNNPSSGGAPGGGLPGGGNPAGGGSDSGEEGEEEEPSYLSDETSGGGFGGGSGGYGGGFGALGGSMPRIGDYSRQANTGGKNDKKKDKFKFKPLGPLNTNKSGSIFDLASKRLQQFCSDYNCPH